MHDGIYVVLDKWELKEGQDKYAFMERCVSDPEICKVLIICDKAYQKLNHKSHPMPQRKSSFPRIRLQFGYGIVHFLTTSSVRRYSIFITAISFGKAALRSVTLRSAELKLSIALVGSCKIYSLVSPFGSSMSFLQTKLSRVLITLKPAVLTAGFSGLPPVRGAQAQEAQSDISRCRLI